MSYKIEKTETEWLAELGPEKYKILRQKGTELPNSGKFNVHFDNGTYHCAACNEQLFASDSKFNAHCGWPSFDASIPGKIEYIKDTSHGMIRTEILCASCGSHLGHVFNDGPTETGIRYCVNSLSIEFENLK
jgi:peptide-methionine (R)-S-oxide reductase